MARRYLRLSRRPATSQTQRWSDDKMRKIGFVLMPGFQMMGFAAVAAFETANAVLESTAYTIELLSEDGGPVRSSAGFLIETAEIRRDQFDTIVIAAGIELR